jgi:V-type H+-transporting ATPase subunit H
MSSKANASNKTGGSTKASAAPVAAPLDLYSADKNEISRTLYGQVQWEELLRNGIILQHRDHQLLERAQSNLSVVLDSPSDAEEYAKMLLKIAEQSTTNVIVQQYVFTRIEEILGIGIDLTDANADAFGTKHAKLFTVEVGANRILNDNAFVRAIGFSDNYVQKSASVAFATLLSVYDGNVTALVSWINSKLPSTSADVWEVALPALGSVTRSAQGRAALMRTGIVGSIVGILRRITVVGKAQHIYELIFALWTLSLHEGDVQAYLAAGTVPTLLEFLATASSKKVIRIIVFTLKNLAALGNDTILNEMFSSGILRLVDNLAGSGTIKLMNDAEADADFRALQDILNRNYRELSSFDRLRSEYEAGALRWGIVHNEKFWRENVKYLEKDDFALLKQMLTFVTSSDPTAVSIALYDIGEFVRFYPNGRVLVSKFGGKQSIMNLLESENEEIQRHALQCVSKIMVTNWEHLN